MTEFTFSLASDSKGDWNRNIVSRRKSVELFAELVDNAKDTSVLIEHELTAKLTRRAPPIIARPFDEADIYNPMLSAIHWEFEHPKATRFSRGDYGVWYGARDVLTSVHETVYHFSRHVSDSAATSAKPIKQERRVHLVRCSASLVDLRPHLKRETRLLDPQDYSHCQQLGARLRSELQPGLITHSVRHPKHDVVAVFAEQALSDPRDVCFFTYSFDRMLNKVTVERTPGKVELTL
jgi:hypothetical protein